MTRKYVVLGGAGDETRTRDSLLGRRFALYAVAPRSISAYSCGFPFLPYERLLSRYSVVNERLPAGTLGSARLLSCPGRRRVERLWALTRGRCEGTGESEGREQFRPSRM